MRWIPFIILAYLLLLVQTTVAAVLTFDIREIGIVGPDLLAICAVFVALQARRMIDVMLVGCMLGFGLDLTTGAGAGGATVVGPMAVAYALGVAGVYRVREAFFRNRPLPQALLALLFVAFAHGFWVTVQSLRAGGIPWATYGAMLLQAGAVALYTAVLTPLGCLALMRVRRWFVTAPAGRLRR